MIDPFPWTWPSVSSFRRVPFQVVFGGVWWWLWIGGEDFRFHVRVEPAIWVPLFLHLFTPVLCHTISQFLKFPWNTLHCASSPEGHVHLWKPATASSSHSLLSARLTRSLLLPVPLCKEQLPILSVCWTLAARVGESVPWTKWCPGFQLLHRIANLCLLSWLSCGILSSPTADRNFMPKDYWLIASNFTQKRQRSQSRCARSSTVTLTRPFSPIIPKKLSRFPHLSVVNVTHHLWALFPTVPLTQLAREFCAPSTPILSSKLQSCVPWQQWDVWDCWLFLLGFMHRFYSIFMKGTHPAVSLPTIGQLFCHFEQLILCSLPIILILWPPMTSLLISTLRYPLSKFAAPLPFVPRWSCFLVLGAKSSLRLPAWSYLCLSPVLTVARMNFHH